MKIMKTYAVSANKRYRGIIQIVNWTSYLNVCKHWIHLKHCHNVTAFHSSDIFYHPCCDYEWGTPFFLAHMIKFLQDIIDNYDEVI